MPVSSNDFISSAIAIAQGTKEIDYRNAASRAYYAAFYEAKRISRQSNGNISQKTGEHEKISQKLRTHKGNRNEDDNIRQIGIELSICKKLRVKADYRISKSFTKNDALTTIQQAKNIIKLSLNFP